MKKIKYITSILLITFVFGFIGELYVWHIDIFESKYQYVNMYLPRGGAEEESKKMIEDIIMSAEENDVEVFSVEQNVINIFSVNKTIYGTSGVEQYLKEDTDIKKGTFHSIFLGDLVLDIKSLNEIPDISNLEYYEVVGDSEDIISFKQDLIDVYGGGFPEEGVEDYSNLLMVIVVWGAIVLLFLLMTLYEIAFIKKEILIKVISGNSVSHIIRKNILIDLIVYITLFISIPLVMSNITTVNYLSNITFYFVFIFLICNSLIYCSLYITDYKKDLHSKQSSRKILDISYGYKIITVILSMSGCLELIRQGIDFYSQKEFFVEHADYSYVAFGSRNYDDELVYKEIYKEFNEKQQIDSLVYLGNDSGYGGDKNIDYILANRETVDYLKEKIPVLKEQRLQDKIYFVIPEKYNNEIVEENTNLIWQSYYKYDYDYEVIEYRSSERILSIANQGEISSINRKIPIIILNNQYSNKPYWNPIYIATSSLFKLTDKEWNQFVVENHYDKEIAYRTNALENYEHQWMLKKRSMYIGVILLLFFCILEIIIIRTILYYEYQIKSTELLLMKISGNSFFERYKKILLITGRGWDKTSF